MEYQVIDLTGASSEETGRPVIDLTHTSDSDLSSSESDFRMMALLNLPVAAAIPIAIEVPVATPAPVVAPVDAPVVTPAPVDVPVPFPVATPTPLLGVRNRRNIDEIIHDSQPPIKRQRLPYDDFDDDDDDQSFVVGWNEHIW